MYSRIYANESLKEWCSLLGKTAEAVRDLDSDGSFILMDDFKGGQGSDSG